MNNNNNNNNDGSGCGTLIIIALLLYIINQEIIFLSNGYAESGIIESKFLLISSPYLLIGNDAQHMPMPIPK